jgi:hypothetical protein
MKILHTLAKMAALAMVCSPFIAEVSAGDAKEKILLAVKGEETEGMAGMAGREREILRNTKEGAGEKPAKKKPEPKEVKGEKKGSADKPAEPGGKSVKGEETEGMAGMSGQERDLLRKTQQGAGDKSSSGK